MRSVHSTACAKEGPRVESCFGKKTCSNIFGTRLGLLAVACVGGGGRSVSVRHEMASVTQYHSILP